MVQSTEPGTPTLALGERLADLQRIAQLSNPILRNLLITQRYHDLSWHLTRVLGSADCNWSTFATWASKTAGQSIRDEELPREVSGLLREEAKLDQRLDLLRRRLGPLSSLLPDANPFDLARAIVAEVSRQIAEGNLRVFHELTPLFARFVDTFETVGQRTTERLEVFENVLATGSAADGGQDELKKAFKCYFEATRTQNEQHRAELILAGNVRIGLHEQTRLQVNIAGALDAPFADAVYTQFAQNTAPWLRATFLWGLRLGVRWFAKEFGADWRRVATRYMMKLNAPNGEDIGLGHDLPPQLAFPVALEKLTNPELIELLRRFDPDLATTRGSAAVDWTVLDQRMRFIGDLFRAGQQDVSWFEAPFEAGQSAQIERGYVPSGRL